MTNEQFRAIEQAARAGDIVTVETIIDESGTGIIPPAYSATTAVALLIRSGYISALDKLVDKEIIPTDLYDYDRFDTSLMNELLKPQLEPGEVLDRYFDWLKGYFDAIDDIDEEVDASTLLEYAMKIKAPVRILKTIAGAGANLSRIDSYGRSLLFKVCDMRFRRTAMTSSDYYPELLEWLLHEGIDPNLKTSSGKTALHAAIADGKTDAAIKLLEAGADANIADNERETAFYYATVGQHNAILLEAMLGFQTPDFQAVTKQGENLLNAYLRAMHSDSSERAFNIVSLLLDHGADIREASLWYDREKTGVDWLAEKPADLLVQVIEAGHLSPHYRDNGGNTLLHKICRVDLNYDQNKAKELYRKVKFLLKQGVDAEIDNVEDKKAVDYAMDDDLKVKTVELLLKHKN